MWPWPFKEQYPSLERWKSECQKVEIVGSPVFNFMKFLKIWPSKREGKKKTTLHDASVMTKSIIDMKESSPTSKIFLRQI